jgi:hypothetical protein
LKFHFQGGKFLSYHFFWLEIYWLRAVNHTQLILGFGKDITLFVNLKYHSHCYLLKHLLRVRWYNLQVTSQISW